MVTSFVTEGLRALEAAPSATKPAGYSQLLDKILAELPEDRIATELVAYCQSILNESVGIVTSRSLLNSFVTKLRSIKSSDVRTAIGTQVLDVLAPKVVSFEEQDTAIKLILADAYQEGEDYVSAAKVLQTITLDSSQRSVSDDDKAQTWIRITRCYLEEDDPTSALTYLNRVKNVIHGVTDTTVRLQFQLSQARISDSQRNFADASRTYYAISQETIIDEDERLQALSAAVTCAILTPAGPQRTQQLSRLFRDERAASIEEHGILEKIFLDRVLAPSEVKAFSEKLQPHQLALTSDGSTVLDKAVLEHNLLAASRLYRNIGTGQLGDMLGVDAERAEVYAAQMIEQGRLKGEIDQIEGLIYFERGEGARGKGGDRRVWDDNVRKLAEEVERVTTMIQSVEPEFYAANMVH
ncbi:COP9 signalosome complex subunit 4 [Sphaceloma murrayae]|uniref:COP9 signalosome complex subunit 4 n=1 Tax=Sphaceloma murrayae TaxID=2082308 RepID=A0A2K1QU45_9PEZI|nr:COP9 signalosome complex subunit 4 [Sphaceloma murrayae]